MEQWTIYLPTAAAAAVALAGYLIAKASAKRFHMRREAKRKSEAGESDIQVIHDEMERAQSSITHSIDEALAALERMKAEVHHREKAGSI